jgi:hypothetical protein
VPITAKGHEIMANMKNRYGEKKGEQVFYASANKGTITGVHADNQLPTSPGPPGAAIEGPVNVVAGSRDSQTALTAAEVHTRSLRTPGTSQR